MKHPFVTSHQESTIALRRKILSRTSRAGNPANAIRSRIQQDLELSNRSFFAQLKDDWSNSKSAGLLGLFALGLLSWAWINPWAGTVDGAYQPQQLAHEYKIVTAEGVASTRG